MEEKSPQTQTTLTQVLEMIKTEKPVEIQVCKNPMEEVTDSIRASMEGRPRRAHEEPMAVMPHFDREQVATGVYAVYSGSGNRYTVSLPDSTCTCPDHTRRGTACKHLRRAAIEVTTGTLPTPGGSTKVFYQTTAPETLCELYNERERLFGLLKGQSKDTQAEVRETVETVEALVVGVEKSLTDYESTKTND